MEVDARVLEVSNETRRISISIREVEPINPSEEVRAEIEARQKSRQERDGKPPRERRERRGRGRQDKDEPISTSYVDTHTPTSIGDLASISAVTDGGAELLDKLKGDKDKKEDEAKATDIEDDAKAEAAETDPEAEAQEAPAEAQAEEAEEAPVEEAEEAPAEEAEAAPVEEAEEAPEEEAEESPEEEAEEAKAEAKEE
jgi:ribosomal protein S1